MPSQHNPNDPLRYRHLGAERFLEGTESIDRALHAVVEREERFKRLYPKESIHLQTAARAGTLPEPCLTIAYFHPIAAMAAMRALEEFHGTVIDGPELESRFAQSINDHTFRILDSLATITPSLMAEWGQHYPELNIPQLQVAFMSGIISRGVFIDAFHGQTELEIALRKISDWRLSQEFQADDRL